MGWGGRWGVGVGVGVVPLTLHCCTGQPTLRTLMSAFRFNDVYLSKLSSKGRRKHHYVFPWYMALPGTLRLNEIVRPSGCLKTDLGFYTFVLISLSHGCFIIYWGVLHVALV